jgi:hypothetical protein
MRYHYYSYSQNSYPAYHGYKFTASVHDSEDPRNDYEYREALPGVYVRLDYHAIVMIIFESSPFFNILQPELKPGGARQLNDSKLYRDMINDFGDQIHKTLNLTFI